MPTFAGLPQRGCRTARRRNVPYASARRRGGGFLQEVTGQIPASSLPILAAPSFFSCAPFPVTKVSRPQPPPHTRGSEREEPQKQKETNLYQAILYKYKQPKLQADPKFNKYNMPNPMLQYTFLQLADMGPTYNDPRIWVSEEHHIRPDLLSDNRGLGPSQGHFGGHLPRLGNRQLDAISNSVANTKTMRFPAPIIVPHYFLISHFKVPISSRPEISVHATRLSRINRGQIPPNAQRTPQYTA